MAKDNDSKDAQSGEIMNYLIPHTHWDREWYVPFQVYRYRLVEMMDELIDHLEEDPEYKHFNLDGQTIVIEDYLEIRPEKKEKIAKLIKEGRIGVGPWYCQNSPWLQTGEGIARNLLFGKLMVDEYGVDHIDVGYVPDQYIHLQQFPQIFKEFGIHHTAFSRGCKYPYAGFLWEGIDGTKVVAFHLMQGYGLCANLSDDPNEALDQCAMELAGLNKMQWATNLRLGFSGSDHSRVSKVLSEVVKMWNEEEELYEDIGKLKISSWKEFLDDWHALNPKLPEVKGELWGAKYNDTMHSVFSSYMPLKQQSFRIHNLLERFAEPFAVIGDINGLEYMDGFIKKSWQWCLKNQPHDSSWTSSVDQVQKEMEVRYDWSEQIGIDIYRRGAQWIAQHIEGAKDKNRTPIVVFNALPWKRSGRITARFENKYDAIQIVNSDGVEIISQTRPVEKTSDEERERRRVFVGSHGSLGKDFVEIKFAAQDVPGMGYKTYFIQNRDNSAELYLADEELLDGNDYYLENEVLRVVVEKDASITLQHRVGSDEVEVGESIWSGETFNDYKGLHLFENRGDVGDGWECKKIKEDKSIITPGKLVSSKLIEANDYQGIMKVERILTIPKSATEDYKGRVSETIDIPITTFIMIQKGSDPVIRFKTILTNTAKDHRIRLLFPMPIHAETTKANGHFGVTDRDIKLPDGKGWSYPPDGIHAFHNWVGVWDEDKKKGLAIFSKGMPEYDCFYSQDNSLTTMALTLYRSVGRWGSHISVKDPVMWIPRAQLYEKEMTFEYAIVPFHTTWDNVKINQLAEDFVTPLKWEENYDTFRYNVQDSQKTLANDSGLFEISPSSVVLSTLKGANDWVNNTNKYILRVYNLKKGEGESEKASITFDPSITLKNIEFVSMSEVSAEEPTQYVHNKESNTIEFEIGPAKIKTLMLEFTN